MTAYETVHGQLKDSRGPAKGYLCTTCGRSASDWALQYDHPERIVWEKPKPYSPDLDDYAPLCRSCHFILDLAVGVRDKGLLDDARRVNLVGARAALQERYEIDQAYRNRLTDIRRENAVAARQRLHNRRCGGCSMITMPGALGKHQKSTGHTGWEDA